MAPFIKETRPLVPDLSQARPQTPRPNPLGPCLMGLARPLRPGQVPEPARPGRGNYAQRSYLGLVGPAHFVATATKSRILQNLQKIANRPAADDRP